MRSDAGDLFITVMLWLIYVISICIGIIGIIISQKKKKKTSKKVLYSILIVLPVVCIFSMYCCGIYRSAPVSENSLNEMAKAIQEKEAEKGTDYFSNEISYYSGEDMGSGFDSVSTCTVDTTQSAYTSRGFFDDKLSKVITTDSGTFVCYPISSQRTAVNLHYGYSGVIDYYNPEGKHYSVSYKLWRSVDMKLGFIYAMPVFGTCDIAELIETKAGKSEGAANMSADKYVKEHFPECSDYYSDTYLVSKYNEDLKSGNRAGTFDSPYNKDVFPVIEEKYDDYYIVLYYDNEYYEKCKSVIAFIIELDTGKIVDVIDNTAKPIE